MVAQKRDVTFWGDLRANGWGYAAPLIGIVLYFVLKALGVEVWLAITLPVLLAAGLGFTWDAAADS